VESYFEQIQSPISHKNPIVLIKISLKNISEIFEREIPLQNQLHLKFTTKENNYDLKKDFRSVVTLFCLRNKD